MNPLRGQSKNNHGVICYIPDGTLSGAALKACPTCLPASSIWASSWRLTHRRVLSHCWRRQLPPLRQPQPHPAKSAADVNLSGSLHYRVIRWTHVDPRLTCMLGMANPCCEHGSSCCSKHSKVHVCMPACGYRELIEQWCNRPEPDYAGAAVCEPGHVLLAVVLVVPSPRAAGKAPPWSLPAQRGAHLQPAPMMLCRMMH